MTRALAGVVMLAGMVAWGNPARPVAMLQGSAVQISMPERVAKVTVEQPELVQVELKGREVRLKGVERGHTRAVLTTASGEEFHFAIQIAGNPVELP